jgi:hypothetical protein
VAPEPAVAAVTAATPAQAEHPDQVPTVAAARLQVAAPDRMAAAAAAAVAVDMETFSAFPSVIQAVTDTVTEGTSQFPGGFGIPAASVTTRDSVSVSMAVDSAVEEVVVADTEAVEEDMEVQEEEDTANNLSAAFLQPETVISVDTVNVNQAVRSALIITGFAISSRF